MAASRLRPLSATQCFKLLRSVHVGRVGISRPEGPLIQPVNFVLLDERVVFRTVSSLKFGAAAANAPVAFETDDYAADGSWGWSVLLTGVAEDVMDDAERRQLRVALLRSWAFPDADRIVRITPATVTGRGFGHAVRALAGTGM